MGSRKITTMGLVMVVLVTMLWPKIMAQQSNDCTSVLITMAPCLNYVSGSSPDPSASCCSQLASVVQSQPRCLCMALNGGGASLGVSINQTLALALPERCNVKTPPVSKCNAEGPSPGTGGSNDPPISSSTSGGRSKTIPATSAGVMIMKMPFEFFRFLLPLALYASLSSNF